MNFLKRLFGAGDPMAGVRRAFQQKRWADVLAMGEEIDLDALEPARRKELEDLLAAGGDALAELNLAEGDAFLRAGDPVRAEDHFRLAAAQARRRELAAAARGRLEGQSVPQVEEVTGLEASSCAGPCCPSPGETNENPSHLDQSTRLELIITGYPTELASRYGRLEGPLLEGFLLAHEGLMDEALERFEQVPAEQRDDLFHFERGVLLARTGQLTTALADLERAVALNPSHTLALETLVDLELAQDPGRAEERLRRMLADQLSPAFAHGQLAVLLARRDQTEEALQHAMTAIETGNHPDSRLLAAALLEQLGRLAAAEALLAQLPGAGCGSGQTPNLPLAEFWLRHGKNLDRALDAFSRAWRQDGSPRWQLRIAEVYLARGRGGEAAALLRKVLASTDLDPQLARTAERLVAQCELGST